MKDEENGSEAGQTGKGDGNRGLPPVVRSISPTGGESKEVPIEPTCSECNIHLEKFYRHRNLISNVIILIGLLSGWCVGYLTNWFGLWSGVGWRLLVKHWHIYPAGGIFIIYLMLILISEYYEKKFGETLHRIENMKPFRQAAGRKLKMFYYFLAGSACYA